MFFSKILKNNYLKKILLTRINTANFVVKLLYKIFFDISNSFRDITKNVKNRFTHEVLQTLRWQRSELFKKMII